MKTEKNGDQPRSGNKVSVNPMSTEEIQKYIESKEPMDKAGAYGIQGDFPHSLRRSKGTISMS